MLIVGKEIPMKKPRTTPTTVVIMSLIVSFGFLKSPLQALIYLSKTAYMKKKEMIHKYINSKFTTDEPAAGVSKSCHDFPTLKSQ